MRLLTVEIVDGETIGKHAAWALSAATWVRRWQSLVRRDTVDHCAEVLSTMMIKGGTPRRQLIVEIVDGETTGNRVIWLLPAVMFAQRRRDEAMVVNGNLGITALSTTKIERAHR